MASQAGKITVLPIPSAQPPPETNGAGGQPAHWVDKKGSGFQNPWPSFRKHGFKDLTSILPQMWFHTPSIPETLKTDIPVHAPTWGLVQSSSADAVKDPNEDKIKSTWLGHACFLVEMPARSLLPEGAQTGLPARGARILFDPVFSERCSPVQIAGPKRFTKIPCEIEEIPEVDVVVISHNHYDHLDTHTIRTLSKRSRPPHIFAPLGNGPYFRSLGIPDERVHILDWWEGRRVEVSVPAKTASSEPASTTNVAFDVTCTPAQHFTGRSINDRFKTLWASWVVEEPAVPNADAISGRPPVKVYFAGDTGYRAVKDGQDENTVPTCPAFKEIGARWNGFDFAMIPIGAYRPRDFMSPIHCAPQDSVRLFQDVKAKKALGMHWGAWVLTTEDVTEPPKRLAEERKKVGIEDGAFEVCDIGQTLFF